MPSNSGRTMFDLDREHAIRDAEREVLDAVKTYKGALNVYDTNPYTIDRAHALHNAHERMMAAVHALDALGGEG